MPRVLNRKQIKSADKSILAAFFVCCLVFAYQNLAYAAPSNTDPVFVKYESIKARSFKLRNTDRSITRLAEWKKVAADFESFASANRSSEYGAMALYQAAVMHEEIYHGLQAKDHLQECLMDLNQIGKTFPKSDIADDALFKLAEIEASEMGDKESAEENYRKIIAQYPQGDMYIAAEQKLAGGDEVSLNAPPEAVSKEKAVNINAPLIVIDPGHGGEDFGAVGVGSLLEKDVVLDVSLEVRRLLEQDGRFRVKLTREKDQFVPLIDRTAFANELEAQLFISIHANASLNKNMSGLEIYYLDNTGDKGSKTLADRENASVQFEGEAADLRYMLSDLIQNAKLGESIQLGKVILDDIRAALAKIGYSIKVHGVKKAPFYVLVGAHMPCVLAELSFIDHPEEGKRLSDKAYRKALAQGIAKGVQAFLPVQ